MRQVSFFEAVFPVHFVRVDVDGSILEFDIMNSLEQIGQAEYIAESSPKVAKMWQDDTGKYHQVFVFSK